MCMFVCVGVRMEFDVLSNSVVLYELFVKCGSAGSCRRKFRSKYSVISVPSMTGIYKLTQIAMSTGSLLGKEPFRSAMCLSNKKTGRNKGSVRKYTAEISETRCTRQRRLETVSSQTKKL
jgi:hypothetical protein